MIDWIKKNIKIGLKCADSVEDFSTMLQQCKKS